LRYVTSSALEEEEDGWRLRLPLAPEFATSWPAPYTLPLLFPPTTSTQHRVLIVSSVVGSTIGSDGPTQEPCSNLTCESLFSNSSCQVNKTVLVK